MQTDCSCVSFVRQKIILHPRNLESHVNIPFVVWLHVWLKNRIILFFRNSNSIWLHWNPLLILCFMSPTSTCPLEVGPLHHQAAINPAVMFVSPCTFLYIFYVWTWLRVSFALCFSPLLSTLSFLPYLLPGSPFSFALPLPYARGAVASKPHPPRGWSVQNILWQHRNHRTLE